MNEEQIRQIIQEELAKTFRDEKSVFAELVQFLDGRNIQVGRTTGTKIGTGADQKLSFYGVTPIVQAGAISAPTSPGSSYLQSEAQSATAAINSIRTALKNFGVTA